MKDLTLPMYDDPREWIRKTRDLGTEWDQIRLAKKSDDDSLKVFLDMQVDANYWPEMTIEEWKALVELQKTAEERTKRIDELVGLTHLHDEKQDNAVTIPSDDASSWQLYKKKLLDDGFKDSTVDEIERTTLSILRSLNSDTTKTTAVKGLVIGNVQSGKTANMAALMAMAADWGWNMFIVLSGTIENLRIQTQNRLFNDLNQQGTIRWRSLEHLSKTVDISQKAQNLHFDDKSTDRYFTVCLKNSARLKKLIQWAQADHNQQEKMKILVIDDEADQAGINTANIDINERKKINKLICALVNGKNEKSEDIDYKYRAMNYIGYTATPYANILNEASEESLYPKNFITTLSVSKEYFGPQQIFGYSGDVVQYEGLDIVRTISGEELEQIKNIHAGECFDAPESLLDAICWFICGVSCMRIWGYKKPISMLVHTSQKTTHHQSIANVISDWLSSTSEEEIIERSRTVWDNEVNEFTFEKFKEQYPDYGRKDETINRYPSFEDVIPQIRTLLGDGISHIALGEDGDLTYHKGIHLCIDNCVNNGVSDGMHVRLAYPDADKMPIPAPAFIVVGGATLSRGLTIEGLISTFFLRSVGQADTLMQMGRWFGYRRNYELLPRLWITQTTHEQFKFLAMLDQELRDEIQYMSITGRLPSEYGPKVKNSPKVSFIRITAKNKMQKAVESDMDYSGASSQTYLFDDDSEIQKNNLALANEFISSLGEEWKRKEYAEQYEHTLVWRNVSFEKVKSFIERFSFQPRLKVFNDTKPLLDWIGQMTEKKLLGGWNVILAGKQDSKNGTWHLDNGKSINKVNRSKKPTDGEADGTINIGTLRDPRDLLADVDIGSIADSKLKAEIVEYIKSKSAKATMAYRDKAGLETTPQLLIYCIDKDSEPSSGNRVKLEAKEDIVGLSLYIPGGRKGTNYASTIRISLDNKVFDGNPDLEGADED